ncbi:hypothetical protein B0H14DRAFT_2958086 [Mycena olivaceomarginata]|nr:hypothetical protein B0H14DRAFT_2958086 [Mycena olivaceomarginata]
MQTSLTSHPLPVAKNSARLDKPLVIPRILEQPRLIRIGSKWGKPFVRAYSTALETYGITKEELLDFIDELNGTLTHEHRQGCGVAIHAVGKMAAWNTACGPYANKVAYLRKANRELFEPKGLRARILSAKELRAHLGMHEWMHDVPTKEELIEGKRATIRSPHRQIFALDGRVAEMDLAVEAAIAWRSEADNARKWAGKGIRDQQIFGEINMELQRGKAIKLRDKALAQPTEAKKQKDLTARKADFEFKMANRNRWLVIEEASGKGPMSG